MSHLHPAFPDAFDNLAEYGVAIELANLLPENWHLVCNLEWTKATKLGQRTGEIDFIVLTATGEIHVIELTLGTLEYDADGSLVLANASKKNKSQQLRSNKIFVIEILKQASRGGMVLPKYRILDWLLAPNTKLSRQIPNPAFEPDFIIDSNFESPVRELASRLLRYAGNDSGKSQIFPEVLKIFLRQLRFYVDPSSLIEKERRYVSGVLPLSKILRDIRSDTNRFVIDGIAGSGKTQIALAGIENATIIGKKVALVSNTKVMPNLLNFEYGASFPAYSYFGFKDLGDEFEEIYVEEAHHFEPAALRQIENRLKKGGRIFYLMDSFQNFDERFISPQGATTICLNETYRLPKKICEYLNLFLPKYRKIKCMSPQVSSHVEIYDQFENEEESFEACLRSLSRFLSDHPNLRPYCSIVYCGSQFQLNVHVKSHMRRIQELLLCDQLDLVEPLRNLLLDRENRSEEITIDTIRRFQGSSNKFIWICGLGKQSSTESAVRLFYSAITRARARCELFCNREFSTQLATALT